MATKEQERKALAQIRKIVDGLGESSYIGCALEGCLGIAEDNIENDWACSMKQQRDIEAKRAVELGYEVDDLRKKLKTAELAERDLRNAIKAAKEEASRTISALRGQSLSADDITDISQLLTEEVFELGKEVSNAAERIVEAATAPNSAAFQNAVNDHRAAKGSFDYYTALLVRVNNLRSVG